MDYLIHLKVEEERRNDIIRQIRNQKEQKTVLPLNASRDPLYAAVLLQLGRTLTDWGLRLQSKYGAFIEIPATYVSTEPIAETGKSVGGC